MRTGQILGKIVRQLRLTSGGPQQKSFTSGAGRHGTPTVKEVLAKRIAASGRCSRREAVRLILAQRVEVNGAVVVDCSTRVSVADSVAVDGDLLEAKRETELIILHKPPKVLTTSHDPGGRKTVYHLLPPHWQQLRCIGRLDYMTEGLLLLTNDGALKRYLELPSTGIEREYMVRIHAADFPITMRALEELALGTCIKGVRYGSISARILEPGNTRPGAKLAAVGARGVTQPLKGRAEGDCAREAPGGRGGLRQCWVSLVLKEGKNREIRRVVEHKGWRVSRLIRSRYGHIELGSLGVGESKLCGSHLVGRFLRQIRQETW